MHNHCVHIWCHVYFVSRLYASHILLQVSQAEQIKQEREGEKKDGDKSLSTDENEIGENGNAIKKEESKRKDKDGD